MSDSSAAEVLAALTPAVENALARHLETAKEWFPHEYVPYERGRNFVDEPWEPSQSALSDIARIAFELNLLTEDNLPYYHLALWQQFGADGPWGEWARRWTAEEGRHSIAMRDYLLTSRAVDPIALERARMDHVARGYYPQRLAGPLDALVYVTLQELATRIAHRNTGAVTRDPIAENLLTRIAVDENLHYVFYRSIASAAIDADASAMVLAMKRQVLGFAMPGLELPDFRDKAIRIAAAGIYDLRIHHDQVLTPVLLTHWRLGTLQGLSDEAERARDRIVAFLESLDASAAQLEAAAAASHQPAEARSELHVS